LTTIVSYSPQKFRAGSRLVITTGICRDSRVLRLTFFLSVSTQSLPSDSPVPSFRFHAKTCWRDGTILIRRLRKRNSQRPYSGG
jgi:hypothetical protein